MRPRWLDTLLILFAMYGLSMFVYLIARMV